MKLTQINVLILSALGLFSFGTAQFTPLAVFHEQPKCKGISDATQDVNVDTCISLPFQSSVFINSSVHSSAEYCLLGYRNNQAAKCGCPSEVIPFNLDSTCLELEPAIESYRFIVGFCPEVICK